MLRWVRVRDFVRVPMPVLLVSLAAPEGVEAKATKSGKNRRGAGRGPAGLERLNRLGGVGGAQEDRSAE